MTPLSPLLDQRSLSKLRWRCRRGLLENDLLIEKFFDHYQHCLTVEQAQGLNDLMELSDNDLLDLLLRRRDPAELTDPQALASASTHAAQTVLNQLRPPVSAQPLVH
jgi:antitoxin CptB